MKNEKQEKIADLLSQERNIRIIEKYEDIKTKYNKIKKIYDEEISSPIKDIIGIDGGNFDNDMVEVKLSPSKVTEKTRPLAEIRQMANSIKKMVLTTGFSPQRLSIKMKEEGFDDLDF